MSSTSGGRRRAPTRPTRSSFCGRRELTGAPSGQRARRVELERPQHP
jgi:hypothetical protein